MAVILTRLGIARGMSRRAASLNLRTVEQMRALSGDSIQPIPHTQTRWYIEDVETATLAADLGDLAIAARLMRAARADGVLSGVMSTRTSGLVRLPKRFRGDAEMVQALTGGSFRARSVFGEMCPDAELALLAYDGAFLGVGVGELVHVEGRPHPTLVRLDPEFLRFNWQENQWYFRSVGGLIPVVPGDGQWVLYAPGGTVAPWQHGLWRALSKAYIRKDHASAYRDNWEAKLAHPARVAFAPHGATQEEHASWFTKVLAWGINTVFGLKPGYDVKLLESNGRGADSFAKTIEEQNNEMILAVTGQTVTTDGGTGFANADVHKSIRADIIKADADALAHAINTQILPAWVVSQFGEDALLAGGVVVEWDVTPPHDRNSEASALVTTANAISLLTEALAVHEASLDMRAIAERFGVPISSAPPTEAALRLVVDNTQANARRAAV